MVVEMRGTHSPGIACREVTREYATSSERVVALAGISVEFHPGRLSVIAGPSGSGKSSLLRILAAIDRPTSGSVHIRGRDVAQLGRGSRRRIRRVDIGYVYQDPAINLLPYMTVAEHIRFTAQLRGGDEIGESAVLMGRFGLTGLSDRIPTQLSSGQQQLASMASAVAGSPAVVIADEPTAELDESSSVAVLESLQIARDLNSCVIVATHDQAVLDVADRMFHIHHGRLEESRR